MRNANEIAEGMLCECEADVCESVKTLVEVMDTIDLLRRMSAPPEIKQVVYSDPVTAVVWGDGSVTRTRCQEGDTYDRQTGLLFCLVKKAYPDWHELLKTQCWAE